jgi:putative ABC transport system permease protein
MLSILIASLGLLGISTFIIRQKVKEIGIRKVLGASVTNIIYNLIKEYAKWIIISGFLACPVAYYLMNMWLQDFAYRIEISWWIFVLSGSIALLIALATVSFQAVKAAMANPVEALKYE